MTRRFFQFSLATMLVFVAAICVVLAVRSNRQHNRRVAIAKIEKLGGRIISLRKWRELSSGGALFYKTKNGEAKKVEVPDIAAFARLLGDDASSSVMAVVFHDGRDVTDADLTDMLPLEELRVVGIGNNPVTDAGLWGLVSFRNLVQVNLTGNTTLTDDGIARFQKAMPNCVIEK